MQQFELFAMSALDQQVADLVNNYPAPLHPIQRAWFAAKLYEFLPHYDDMPGGILFDLDRLVVVTECHESLH